MLILRLPALASSGALNKIQNPTAGCQLLQSKGTFVSSGTLVSVVSGRQHLRSADQFGLVVNRCRLSSKQKPGFAVAGPLAWSDLKVVAPLHGSP